MDPAPKSHTIPHWNIVLLLALCINCCLSYQEEWCFDDQINYLFIEPIGKSCGDDMCRCHDDEAICNVVYGSSMKPIPPLPKTIKRLRCLEDSEDSRTAIHEQLFSTVMHITHLCLATNRINYIPPGTFRQFQNLTCLNLDYNYLKFTDIRNALSSAPTLRYFTASKNWFTLELDKCNFSGINSHIRKMVLTENLPVQTGQLDLSCFCAFQSIEELNLRRSKIASMMLNCTLNVKELNLRENKLDEFSFSGLNPQNLVSFLPNLEYLDLAGNSIEPAGMEKRYLPNLRFLDLTLNHFSDGIIPFTTNYYPKLEVLIFDHQSKSKHTSIFESSTFNDHIPPLTNFSLIGNRFNFAKHDFLVQFEDLTTLLNLTLDDNEFMDVTDEKFKSLFGTLSSLEVISLKNCNLEKVSMAIFTNFPRLKYLDLSMNRISESVFPSGAFDPLQQLTVLLLSRNKLRSVNENFFSPTLRGQLHSLSLSQNPFTCSCDLLWFKTWLNQDKELFGNVDDYFCDNIPNTALANFKLTKQQCLLSQQASVLIITVCSLVIITLTAFILAFSYRWHIRLLLYEAFRGHGDVRRQRLLANNFDYDVFVSYASEDLPWVREHLMPELEGNLDLRLCIHERDFIAGNNIVDNIAECVESSKKILMVFSKDFVLSQWCQFELSFCLRHVMDHDDVLIIVCVDDVTSRRMTTTMMAVLKTTTYIQWEELDDAVDAFWGRLRLALNEIFIGENQV